MRSPHLSADRVPGARPLGAALGEVLLALLHELRESKGGTPIGALLRGEQTQGFSPEFVRAARAAVLDVLGKPGLAEATRRQSLRSGVRPQLLLAYVQAADDPDSVLAD